MDGSESRFASPAANGGKSSAAGDSSLCGGASRSSSRATVVWVVAVAVAAVVVLTAELVVVLMLVAVIEEGRLRGQRKSRMNDKMMIRAAIISSSFHPHISLTLSRIRPNATYTQTETHLDNLLSLLIRFGSRPVEQIAYF